MNFPPGIRRINPDEEAARLARDRLDPPGREWGVRHPGGKVTVFIDGHAFPSRSEAETERTASDQDCDSCHGGTHTLVCRDRQPWREP
jgi:hypothetical protein